MILLSWLSTTLVLAVLLVLAVALVRIGDVLRRIGGTPTSFLAKLRVGLRAIDVETAHLEPQVTALNSGLAEVASAMQQAEAHLAAATGTSTPRDG